MTQIDDMNNLISEFEKVQPTISQLQEMATGAADLKAKLSAALADATTKLANIDATQQKLNQDLADVRSLKQSLESRINESKVLEGNVSRELIRIKNELTSKVDAAISDLEAKQAEIDAALQKFTGDSAQLLAGKSQEADSAITDLKNSKDQELRDLLDSANAALQNFNTQSAPLLADIPTRLQQLDADKQAAIAAFKASVDKAIASLPGQFDQLKGQLGQAMQTHVGNELQQFLTRQNMLVSNLNQRIDALENLNRTQQENLMSQLQSTVTKLQRLEDALEKRGGGFLGLFR